MVRKSSGPLRRDLLLAKSNGWRSSSAPCDSPQVHLGREIAYSVCSRFSAHAVTRRFFTVPPLSDEEVLKIISLGLWAKNLSRARRSPSLSLESHLSLPYPMFKNTFQSGFLSILYSLGSKPLQIWDKEVSDGHVKRLQDDDIQSNVLEIVGANLQSTYITCPADPTATLGIKLPFLVLIVKNLNKYFSFEIHVLDDRNVRRRFRASNFQSVTRVKPFICTMPLKMDDGWNNIQLNLSDLTRRAYGTNYVETLRVQVHGNCRLRRIYFSDRLYSEEELPPEFKLYLPVQKA